MSLYPPAATHFHPLPHPTPARFLALLASFHHDKGRESSKILSTHRFKEKGWADRSKRHKPVPFSEGWPVAWTQWHCQTPEKAHRMARRKPGPRLNGVLVLCFLLTLHLLLGKWQDPGIWKKNQNLIHLEAADARLHFIYLKIPLEPVSISPNLPAHRDMGVLCPLSQSEWLNLVLEYQVTTQASVFCFWTKGFSKTPQDAATKLIFQGLISWALPPSLSSEQPPSCSGLSPSLGTNRQPFEKNLVATSYLKAHRGKLRAKTLTMRSSFFSSWAMRKV